jgi:hypothetical protein
MEAQLSGFGAVESPNNFVPRTCGGIGRNGRITTLWSDLLQLLCGSGAALLVVAKPCHSLSLISLIRFGSILEHIAV